jgi:hypothetical protein
MAKPKKNAVRCVRATPASVRKFWTQFVERNAERIKPYEQAQALTLAKAGQRVCL